MVDVWSAVIGGVTGVVGSVIGAAVNEILRRSNRIEGYSAKIFDKRLAAYEALFEHMHEGYDVASEVMSNLSFTPEERHEAISIVIHDIARFSDANELYLDDDLRAHCVATFMGAEDVLAVADEAEREAQRAKIRRMFSEARRMIREDSGVAGVDRLLKRVARPRLSGEFIDYLRTQRRALRR
jgi:hypothetical protein